MNRFQYLKINILIVCVLWAAMLIVFTLAGGVVRHIFSTTDPQTIQAPV